MKINPTVFYSVFIVGLIGTFFAWQMGRFNLALGWWCGVGVGIINFSLLISSIRKVRDPQEKKVLVPRQPFFVRYLVLALVFFLVLQLGRDQFGVALLAFASYYVVMLIDYVIRLKKSKAS